MNKEELENYYKNELILKKHDDLFKFLDEEAGTSKNGNFVSKYSGNLELQQIPIEYVNLLEFFKNNKIEKYLELGVGNGGSFFLNSIFLQKTCKLFHCVDSLEYEQKYETISKKIDKLKDFFKDKEFVFHNLTTDLFFIDNLNIYDCIFIDADHSYEGVKKDFINSLNFINKGGYIIFHDISNANTGVKKFWEEIKTTYKVVGEYIHPNIKNCGIGLITI